MKTFTQKTKRTALFVFILFFFLHISGQNYHNIVNYNINGIPTYGVKIKTNLPFQDGHHMPAVKIEGYNFDEHATINLSLVWYVHGGVFVHDAISGHGGSNPNVWLSNENGKVVIFLDQKLCFQRFTVSVFAQGMSEISNNFAGWTVVDEPLGGSNQKKVEYKNNFAGNVGIGTNNPLAKLHINSGANNPYAAILATSAEGNNLVVSSHNTQPVNVKVFSITHEYSNSNRNNGSINFYRGG